MANTKSNSFFKRLRKLGSMDYFRNKRVLVTGAAGFVGSHLVDALVDLGATVRGTLHTLEPYHKNTNCEYLKVNLEILDDCKLVTRNIDFVFMCAANSSGAAVIQETPLAHLTPNIVMNSQMLSAAYESKVSKFCFISSNTVYPETDFPVQERDSTGVFFDKYFIVGWMKKFSEIMCEMYSTKITSPMQCVVIRPGNLYGPRDKFKKSESKVIAALIRRAFEGEDPFEVWGDGQDVKDFLFIEDFIKGLLLVFSKTSYFNIYNIASGEPIKVQDVLKKILDLTNQQHIKINYDSSKPKMLPVRLINIDKIKNDINWAPSTSIDLGLQKTYEWYRSNFSILNPEGFPYDN